MDNKVKDFPRFRVGQLIFHSKFNYRGVIMQVDVSFKGTEDWYAQVARSKPPKDKPWYHVLVDGASHSTYVAERHLETDSSQAEISNPMVAAVFTRFEDGRYMRTLN